MNILKKNRKYIVLFFSFLLISFLFGHFGWASVVEQLKVFPLELSAGVMLLIVLNTLVVIFRYWRILAHLGFKLPWWLIFRASAAANLASLVIIPLFGQVAGRQAVLQEAGVTAVENAAIAGYERVLVGGVSAVLACLGGVYLLGNVVSTYIDRVPYDEILPIVGVALLLSMLLSMSRFERMFFKRLLSVSSLLKFVEAILITLVSSVLMLGSFAVLFHFVAPDAGWLSLFSAAAVVSFVAGLPISFGGWGPREAISVYVLGFLSVGSEKALAASILCGMLSIMAILVLAPFALKGPSRGTVLAISTHRQLVAPSSGNVESIAAWILCFAVALLIMFQVNLPFGNAVININVADPFAVLALSVLVLNAIFQRQLPKWRVTYFNGALLLMSVMLCFGFMHSWLDVGSSPWAYGKLLGWFVLLGYLAAGYLATSYFGVSGARRVVEIMVTVLCLVLLLQVVLRALHVEHLMIWKGYTPSIEGYSGNRNALAFQILAVSAAFMGFAPLYRGRRIRLMPGLKSEWFFAVALAWMWAGLYYTSSRTGIAVGLMLLTVATMTRVMSLNMMSKVLLMSVLFWSAILYLPEASKHLAGFSEQVAGSTIPRQSPVILGAPDSVLDDPAHSVVLIAPPLVKDVAPVIEQLQPSFSGASSDALRWSLVKQSITVWLQAPVFGNGLGYFITNSPEWFGFPVIIHNTFLWLLAEIGLLGACSFLISFIWLSKYLYSDSVNRVRNNSALLLVFSFAMMSLFHEVLYQRVFWFVLGALVAVGFSSVQRKVKMSRPDAELPCNPGEG